MIMRTLFAVLATGVLNASGATAQTAATSAYLSFEIGGEDRDVIFGGFNTLGNFANADEQNTSGTVANIGIGLRDHFNIGSVPVSSELTLGFSGSDNITSASFPGLPNPLFFYQSDYDTARIGWTGWGSVLRRDAFEAQVGLGVGMQRTSLSGNDTVLIYSGTDLSPFATVGLRGVWHASDRASYTATARYTVSAPAEFLLGPGPTGTISTRTEGFDIRFGIQISFGAGG